MSIKMRCSDYGYECDLVLDEELTMGLIGKLRDHFEEEHGLDSVSYTHLTLPTT